MSLQTTAYAWYERIQFLLQYHFPHVVLHLLFCNYPEISEYITEEDEELLDQLEELDIDLDNIKEGFTITMVLHISAPFLIPRTSNRTSGLKIQRSL